MADDSDHTVDLYRDLREYESHFNGVEAGLRRFASGWLLAALGAIAFLLRTGSPEEQLLVSRLLAIAVVALLANVGLMILWVLDQLVYHRLLNSCLVIGLRMEQQHAGLPPIRTVMLLNAGRRGMSSKIHFYYVGPMVALSLIAVGTVLLRPDNQPGSLVAVSTAIAAAFVASVALAASFRIGGDVFKNRAGDFGDDFQLYIDKFFDGAGRDTVRRYKVLPRETP